MVTRTRKRKKKASKAPTLPADIRFTAIQRRKINKFVIPLMALGFVCATFNISAVYHKHVKNRQNTAKGIIIGESSHLYPLPSLLSEDRRIPAPMGLEVAIVNHTYDWYQVRTPNGKYWVEASNLMLE